MALWDGKSSTDYRAIEAIAGEAEQIYMTFDSIYDEGKWKAYKKICIPFHLQKSDIKKAKKNFIGISSGFLVIKDNSYYKGKTAGTNILNETIKYLELAMDPMFLYAVNYDNNDLWELNVSFKLRKKANQFYSDAVIRQMTIAYKHLNEIPPFVKISPYAKLHSNLPESIPDKSPYYYSICCYKPEGSILEEYNFSEWSPILPQEKMPITIIIYRLESEWRRSFKHSLPARIFGTPLAIIVDAATSPFQLIIFFTTPLWMPR
ncbi:MAG: hypothetical protein ABIK92_19950 [Pseudomonadota bacterium]